MGYYIFSYAIDPAKVKNVIGTTASDLFDTVLETEEFDLYSEQDFEDHTTTKQALEQMILGKRHSILNKYNKDSAHAYWYAFIAICGALGERLPASHEIKLSYETDLIDKYLLSDFGIKLKIDELLLVSGEEDFGLPKVTDWPMCGLLSLQELAIQRDRFASIDITDAELERLAEEDHKKEMVYDSIRQLKENIDYCLSKQLSLISFCH